MRNSRQRCATWVAVMRKASHSAQLPRPHCRRPERPDSKQAVIQIAGLEAAFFACV